MKTSPDIDNLKQQRLHQLIKIDNGKISTVIRNDLSSAFNTVDHEILIQKHDHYGICGKCFKLLKRFHTDRTQVCQKISCGL